MLIRVFAEFRRHSLYMDRLDFEGWTCPLPLRDYPRVVLGHGGGGRLSGELIEHIFLPAFANDTLAALGDSARIETPASHRLAFTTDSFVVSPLFFRGGDIGSLAVNGTVNDLAMSGARPLVLSAGFIIEEGLSVEDLGRIVQSMAAAANIAGVKIVTGDTKVVERGKGDGLFINTSGIGAIPDDVDMSADKARVGDYVIVSGEIGLHGIAIMSQREGLEFDAEISSDCAALNSLVEAMLKITKEIRVLRDPTRGGLATALNEIAKASNVGIRLDDERIPVPRTVRAACELLGLDPLYVANEGKLVAVVPREHARRIIESMQSHPLGTGATIVGEVTDQNPGFVVLKTTFGTTRILDLHLGEQLPRIC